MDGNGRWAKARGLPRLAGHRAGGEAVRRSIKAAINHGVRWLTLYAFSAENWARPAREVLDLTGLLRFYLKSEIADLAKEGVRLSVIGEPNRFPSDIQGALTAAEQLTAGNERLYLTVALSYGARSEIVAAARAAAAAIIAGKLSPEELDEQGFASYLSTAGTPDPDLIIRTSGERRLSNFLLWQAAYAELVFLDVLWPDFGESDFAAAVAEFTQRERRFGARPG
ncbi:MAG: polyprenyl diphosphate synthase [Acetobacteraceae bacterium]